MTQTDHKEGSVIWQEAVMCLVSYFLWGVCVIIYTDLFSCGRTISTDFVDFKKTIFLLECGLRLGIPEDY